MLTPTPICLVEPIRTRMCPERTASHNGWRRAGSAMSCTQPMSPRDTPRSTRRSVTVEYTDGDPSGLGTPASQNTTWAAPGRSESG